MLTAMTLVNISYKSIDNYGNVAVFHKFWKQKKKKTRVNYVYIMPLSTFKGSTSDSMCLYCFLICTLDIRGHTWGRTANHQY